jgi:hypothetical protein
MDKKKCTVCGEEYSAAAWEMHLIYMHLDGDKPQLDPEMLRAATEFLLKEKKIGIESLLAGIPYTREGFLELGFESYWDRFETKARELLKVLGIAQLAESNRLALESLRLMAEIAEENRIKLAESENERLVLVGQLRCEEQRKNDLEDAYKAECRRKGQTILALKGQIDGYRMFAADVGRKLGLAGKQPVLKRGEHCEFLTAMEDLIAKAEASDREKSGLSAKSMREPIQAPSLELLTEMQIEKIKELFDAIAATANREYGEVAGLLEEACRMRTRFAEQLVRKQEWLVKVERKLTDARLALAEIRDDLDELLNDEDLTEEKLLAASEELLPALADKARKVLRSEI